MGYQTNTETENKKDSSLENVSEINRESGFITAEDILKIVHLLKMPSMKSKKCLMKTINISTKKKTSQEKEAATAVDADEIDKGDIDDSVKMYLREIGMIKLLKPDEEIRLLNKLLKAA